MSIPKVLVGLLGLICVAVAISPPAQSDEPSTQAAHYGGEKTSVHTQLIEGSGRGAPGEQPFGYQAVALPMLEHLADANPNSYVSHGRDRTSDAEIYWINFTAEPSSEVIDQLSRSPFDTYVSWGFPFSHADMSEMTQAIGAAADSSPMTEDFRVGPIDTATSQVLELGLDVVPGADPQKVAAEIIDVAKAKTSLLRVNDAQVPVRVETGAGGYSYQHNVKGGHAVPQCTTGFTASWNGQLGIITAGHCTSLSVYDSTSGVFDSTGRPLYPTYGSGFGTPDVRFGATTSFHTTSKIFRDSKSSEQTVTGVGTPAPGMDICNFGLVSDRHCGGGTPLRIVSASFCGTVEGRAHCGLAETNRRVTADGDSGGPWFVPGGGAYGIHTGASADTSLLTGATAIQSVGITIRQN